MKTRTCRIFCSLATLAVAATASIASAQAQHITIPFDPTPSMYIPQAALDPPRPPRSQNVGVARGQSPATRATSTSAQFAAPASSGAAKAAKAAKSVEPNGTRRAVLFAVGEFVDSKLAPLDGTRNDMALIYDRLTAHGNVSPERIVVLADGDGSEFAPGVKRIEPTCANFTHTVKRLADAQKKNDVLFIFVSTHGQSRTTLTEKTVDSKKNKVETRRSFLYPKDGVAQTDAVGDNGETEDEFARLAKANNLIPTLELLKELQKSEGKVVVIIDACQSEIGSETWNFNSEFDEWAKNLREDAHKSDAAKIAYADSNMTILTACSSGQTSRQITVGDKTYGAFTYAFAEGLGGAADWYGAIDGEIKLLEAYNYASGKTRRLTNGKQAPTISEAADAYKIVVTTTADDLGLDSDAEKIYEKVKIPDDAEIFVKNGSDLSILTQTVQDEPDDVDVWFLTGYAMRLRGSEVKEARGKSWIAALVSFERAGEELTLFVDGRYDSASSQGCLIYPSSDSDRKTGYIKDENGQPVWSKHGTAVTIDRIEKVKLDGKTEYRARISRLRDMPLRHDYWVACQSLNWDRSLAERVVYSKASNIAPTTAQPGGPMGIPGASSVGVRNMPRPPFNL